MKNKMIRLLLLLVVPTALFSQVPGTLSYQGILLEDDGVTPLADGTHSIEFNFYDGGGTAVTTARTISVNTTKGLFTCIIGDGTANNAALPATLGGEEIYIGIKVDGGTELLPRARLTPALYAFQAQAAYTMNAAGLTGTIDNARLDPDLQDLADGSLTGSVVGTGVDAANITTGIVDNARLDADLQDLADGILNGAGKVSGNAITSGIIGGTTGINTSGSVTTTNKMGVGTAAPNTQLDIRGTGLIAQFRAPFPAIVTGTNNAGALYFGADATSSVSPTGGIEASWGGATNPQIGIGVTRDGLRANAIFDFTGNTSINNGTTAIAMFRSTGNVGIGTVNPGYTLDVNGTMGAGRINVTTPSASVSTNGILISGNVTNELNLEISNSASNGARTFLSSNQGFGAVQTNRDLVFNVGGIFTERMRIDETTGFVGIGTASPFYKLHVVGETRSENAGGGSSVGVFGFGNGYGVWGQGGVYGVYGTGTTYGVYCSGNGAYTGSWTDISDGRLKKDIVEMKDALARVMLLKPYTYFYKSDEYSFMALPTTRQLGLIAQELEPIFPELVTDNVHPGDADNLNDDFSYKGVDYIGFAPVLIKAMQEQQSQIEDLKAELAEIKQLLYQRQEASAVTTNHEKK